MVRKVFFSFHYNRDVFRVMTVRNSWVVRGEREATPFYDKAEFEEVKKKAGGIEKWIENQLHGTSVTVVLYGAETYERPWVRHEMLRSYKLGKGMIAVDIHKIRDMRKVNDRLKGADVAGRNPLEYWYIEENGRRKTFADMYASYDYVNDDGYNNLSRWVEAAARSEGR